MSRPSTRIEPAFAPIEARDAVEERGLACAVRADQRRDRSGQNLESDACQRLQAAKGERQVVDRQAGSRPPFAVAHPQGPDPKVQRPIPAADAPRRPGLRQLFIDSFGRGMGVSCRGLNLNRATAMLAIDRRDLSPRDGSRQEVGRSAAECDQLAEALLTPTTSTHSEARCTELASAFAKGLTRPPSCCSALPASGSRSRTRTTHPIRSASACSYRPALPVIGHPVSSFRTAHPAPGGNGPRADNAFPGRRGGPR